MKSKSNTDPPGVIRYYPYALLPQTIWELHGTGGDAQCDETIPGSNGVAPFCQWRDHLSNTCHFNYYPSTGSQREGKCTPGQSGSGAPIGNLSTTSGPSTMCNIDELNPHSNLSYMQYDKVTKLPRCNDSRVQPTWSYNAQFPYDAQNAKASGSVSSLYLNIDNAYAASWDKFTSYFKKNIDNFPSPNSYLYSHNVKYFYQNLDTLDIKLAIKGAEPLFIKTTDKGWGQNVEKLNAKGNNGKYMDIHLGDGRVFGVCKDFLYKDNIFSYSGNVSSDEAVCDCTTCPCPYGSSAISLRPNNDYKFLCGIPGKTGLIYKKYENCTLNDPTNTLKSKCLPAECIFNFEKYLSPGGVLIGYKVKTGGQYLAYHIDGKSVSLVSHPAKASVFAFVDHGCSQVLFGRLKSPDTIYLDPNNYKFGKDWPFYTNDKGKNIDYLTTEIYFKDETDQNFNNAYYTQSSIWGDVTTLYDCTTTGSQYPVFKSDKRSPPQYNYNLTDAGYCKDIGRQLTALDNLMYFQIG